MNEIRYDIPPPQHPRKGTSKYRFGDMGVGGSFFVPSISVAAMRQAARLWRARHGGDFIVRGEGNGARVWRTK